MNRKLWVLALLAVAAATSSVQAQSGNKSKNKDKTWKWSSSDRDDDRNGPGRQRLDTTIAFGPNGSLDLKTMSGDIKVTTWNRNEAKISAYVEEGELVVNLSNSRIGLEAVPRRGRVGDHEFTLTVPVGTRVQAHSVSGDVSVRGAHAALECESVSGDVRVDDAIERIELSTISGSVIGTRLNGTVRASAVSGDVELKDVVGDVSIESVSGDASVVNAKSSDVRAQSVSGEITYSGSMDAAGRYDFKSHSGDVNMEVPGDAKASVTVRTFSGEVESDFPMTLAASSGTMKRRDNRMDFTINGGGARVQIESFSGTINIRKPGKTTKDN
jgi:DUF4097 and DUF4098 domain-containing protein YvlB